MNAKRIPRRFPGLVILGFLLISGMAWAASSGTVDDAFGIARQAISPALQTRVISVYGVGLPDQIQKWYIIFYDPGVPSHGRGVLVENSQILKTYVANGGVVYSGKLTFDPARITSEGPALSAAQGYAAQHHLVYDTVTALLKQTGLNQPFRWRIGLVSHGVNRGFVLVNAVDDTVALYEPPVGTAAASSTDEDQGFGHDVKKTFLGIGGDLQEFFTGQRTVDK